MKDFKDYSLLSYNTFGMDVKASRFIEYSSVDELKDFLYDYNHGLSVYSGNLPLLHIGGGSNLLFTSDFNGVVLHSAIKGFEKVAETDGWVDIKAGAGEVWDDFVAYTVNNGLYGAENLSIIPGEVGASAVQNIGAYGVEVKDIIRTVHTICLSDLSSRDFSNEECCYSYRKSIFKGELKGKYIVTHVTYRLSKKENYHIEYGNISSQLERSGLKPTLENVRNTIISVRRSKLPEPSELGNAGSFFMNPVVSMDKFNELIALYPDMPHYPFDDSSMKIPAGWMIDQCGWKGHRIGPAGVYEKQALVIVNHGGATGKDITELADRIVESVYEKFGVRISPEVNYI